jgi:hypothetical protein
MAKLPQWPHILPLVITTDIGFSFINISQKEPMMGVPEKLHHDQYA